MESTARWHRLITGCHALTGLLTAVWGAGLPATDARLDLGPGRLGTTLLILALGALLAMAITGRLVDRWSSARILRVALPATAVALAITGTAPTAELLMIMAASFGMACGALNVALSTEAVAVERALARPVITRMHGFWTLGAAAGGLLVAAALQLGLDSRMVITGGALLLAVAGVGTVRRMPVTPRPASTVIPSTDAPATGSGAPRFRAWQLIALGILGASAFITEGAATDWSGVHATRVLGASPAVGSIVYALFFAAMTLVRFFGDAFRARLGAGRTVRIAGTIAATGYGLVLLSGIAVTELQVQVGCAVAGWALAGAGMAIVWPVVISTLGSGGADASRLSMVTMISYGGGLVGPALIGHVADATSLSTALLIPAGLAVLVAVTAPMIVRGRRTTHDSKEMIMSTSYSTTLTVDRTPADVYDAINDLRGWWIAEIDGGNDRVGAEFSYAVPDLHSCTLRVTELVPGRRIVWRVVASEMTFVLDRSEWVGTEVTFDLDGDADATRVHFTHVGLVPEHECFEVCAGAWSHYVGDSLRSLLTTGAGKPSSNPAGHATEPVT